MRTAAILFLLSFILSACIPRQPAHQDTYAGLDVGGAPPAFPQLTLALILSENTKNSVKFGYQSAAVVMFDPSAAIERDRKMYQRNFKAVINADRFEDAKAVNADLVAVHDQFVDAMSSKRRWEYKISFFTPEREPLEEIVASEPVRCMICLPEVWLKAYAKVMKRIEETLRGSRNLAAYAKDRAQVAAVAKSARQSAAPAKVYHSEVDRPGYSLPEDPGRFALVVGIEKYAGLPEALFAERDARAVKEHLLALGYPQRNVVFLTGQEAGKAGIEKYVESWLPRNVKEGSRVFVYFSGHGAPDPENGLAYLVPWDGDPKFLENTGYPLRRLYEKLNSLKAEEVIVAMDACFSGAGGRSVLARGTRPLVTRVDAGASNLGKVVILSAAGGDEITGTEESQGHGVFTYYLLKGLMAGEGTVTIKGLYDYLLPKVQDAARRDNRDQTPRLLPESLGPRASLKLR